MPALGLIFVINGENECSHGQLPKKRFFKLFRMGRPDGLVLVALPAGVGLAVLREPVVRLFFARGAFDEQDAAMTVFALLCFSFGLAGQCLGPVLTLGFYAPSCAKVVFRGSGQPLKGTGQVLPVVSKAQKHWWRLLLVGACFCYSAPS